MFADTSITFFRSGKCSAETPSNSK